MTAISISAKRKDDTAATAVTYDLGDNLGEMVAKFGESIVFNKAKQSIVIDAQALVRRAITPNKEGVALSQPEVQALIAQWKPDGRVVVKQSAAEKAQSAISAMTPEERKELLKKLKAEGLV